jgi:hypothetical protein
MAANNLIQTQGKYGGSARAVKDIFDSWGQFAARQRDVKRKESFLSKASEGNKDYNQIVQEIIAEETQNKPKGVSGAMQRLGLAFAPPESPMMDAMTQNVMRSVAPVSKYAAAQQDQDLALGKLRLDAAQRENAPAEIERQKQLQILGALQRLQPRPGYSSAYMTPQEQEEQRRIGDAVNKILGEMGVNLDSQENQQGVQNQVLPHVLNGSPGVQPGTGSGAAGAMGGLFTGSPSSVQDGTLNPTATPQANRPIPGGTPPMGQEQAPRLDQSQLQLGVRGEQTTGKMGTDYIGMARQMGADDSDIVDLQAIFDSDDQASIQEAIRRLTTQGR